MLQAILLAIQIYTREGDYKYTVLYQDPQYIVIEVENGDVILVFYGTRSLSEWYENWQFKIVNRDGFPAKWFDKAVETYLTLTKLSITPKYVIGYSRGGAIALIYSFYFRIAAVAISPPKVSSRVRYWAIKPVIIGSLNDPIRFVPLFYFLPGSYIAVFTAKGGHLWQLDKFTEEVKFSLLHNLDGQKNDTG